MPKRFLVLEITDVTNVKKGVKKAGKTFLRLLPEGREVELSSTRTKDKMVSKLRGDTREYYSAIKKNSFGSVLMRWMKLEPIIQSEVSQKDKDHYSMLTHIYGI